MGGKRKPGKVSDSKEEKVKTIFPRTAKLSFFQGDKLDVVELRILHLDRFSLVVVPAAYLAVVAVFLATHAA